MTRASGLPRPTVYRLLVSLERGGLLAREPHARRFAVSARLVRFAREVLMNSALRGAHHAVLQTLVDEIGETCNLAMLDGAEVVYLDRVETAWPLRMTLSPGSRVPVHCSASGKLLLACLPRAQCEKLIANLPPTRYTENTITGRAALRKELDKIRRRRLATDDEEYLAGLVCVAVPVFDAGGRAWASVAVQAPVSRMPLKRALAHVPALKRAAKALARVYDEGDAQPDPRAKA